MQKPRRDSHEWRPSPFIIDPPTSPTFNTGAAVSGQYSGAYQYKAKEMGASNTVAPRRPPDRSGSRNLSKAAYQESQPGVMGQGLIPEGWQKIDPDPAMYEQVNEPENQVVAANTPKKTKKVDPAQGTLF
jgi:hypothetical protein